MKEMTKHDATEIALQVLDLKDEITRLKKVNNIDALEKKLESLRKELDGYTHKKDCSLIGGVKVLYTTVSNFSKELFEQSHPEIDMKAYYVDSSRFNKIVRE